MADNPLEFLFTPGYQPSFDDPDGSRRLAELEISGKPGTIQKTLGDLGQSATPVATQQVQSTVQPSLYADVEFLNSLSGISSGIPVEEQGEFSKGISRGWRQLKADAVATGGTLASLMGFEDTASSAFQKYQEIMDEA